jgi:hypothetical protein
MMGCTTCGVSLPSAALLDLVDQVLAEIPVVLDRPLQSVVSVARKISVANNQYDLRRSVGTLGRDTVLMLAGILLQAHAQNNGKDAVTRD